MTSTTPPTEEDDEQVVMKQTLLSVNEVFVYRIPPMKISGGYRAEDWDLAKPVQTCQMLVERINDACRVQLWVETLHEDKVGSDKSLYCQSIMTLQEKQMNLDSYYEPVLDSSRYFMLQIQRQQQQQSASSSSLRIGIGFRERNDASNFQLALQDYTKAMKREWQALHMSAQFEADESSLSQDASDNNNNNNKSADGITPIVSKLTLKEGEKIHINLKGHDGGGTHNHHKPKSNKPSSGKPILLKKPPSAAAATKGMTDTSSSSSSSQHDKQEKETVTNEDDDEWGEFEAAS